MNIDPRRKSMNTMKQNEIIDLIKSIPQGASFLTNYPENDVFFKELDLDEMNRIAKEYPGIFPFRRLDQATMIPILSVLVIARIINRRGYPKLKVYFRPDTKEVLRILTSE